MQREECRLDTGIILQAGDWSRNLPPSLPRRSWNKLRVFTAIATAQRSEGTEFGRTSSAACGMGGNGGVLAAAIFTVLLAGSVVEGCSINIRNNCGYRVTSCAQSGNNPIQEWQLRAGGSQLLDFGAGCTWSAGAVWASVRGACRAPGGPPNAANDRNLANLAEFTIGAPQDFYDLSNVNAYTIPLLINPTAIAGGEARKGYRCGSPKCSVSSISALCTAGNQLQRLPSTAYTCINTDGTAGRGPSAGTAVFKAACPSAYSYNFDDATSTFTCTTGSSYEVVFCP